MDNTKAVRWLKKRYDILSLPDGKMRIMILVNSSRYKRTDAMAEAAEQANTETKYRESHKKL